MRKIVAIFLLQIYLFNLIGYSLLFDYFIHRSDQGIVQRVDDGDYSESEFFEIKIPLNLPYLNNWNDYERYDGRVELNGIHYNFVKRKVANDTLYLLCLPNHDKTELFRAKNEYTAKEGESMPPSSSKKGMESLGKKNINENEHNPISSYHFPLITLASISLSYKFTFRLTSCFIATPGEPPEITG